MPDIRPYHALIISCLLLLFSFGCTPEPIETDLLLPVDFSNVPDNMVLTRFHTDKIEIKIRTHPDLLDQINKKNIRYTVDLYTDLEYDPAGDSASIESGAYLIPVEKKRIPLGPGIKLLNINPSYLSVELERKVSKTLNVTVPYTGEPAKGYIALQAAISPPTVTVTGAASMVQSIVELKTKAIDISNAKEPFKQKIPLDTGQLSSISTSEPIVTVTVPIQQQLVSKTIEQIPVQIRNAPSVVMIEPAEITIRIKGPFEALSNPELLNKIYAFIDLKGLDPGVYARHAVINIPAELMMTDAVPKVFTVKVE